MVSDGAGVLAWSTPSRSLIIVGAAAFNFQSQIYDKKPQAAPMAFLPPNAQVPDGIAVAISTIEALNAYMPASGGQARTYVVPKTITADPTSASQPAKGSHNPDADKTREHRSNLAWNINFNTSNRTQIAAYIASTSDTDAFTANLQVAAIIYLRSKNNFGLSDTQVEFVLDSIAKNVELVAQVCQRFRRSPEIPGEDPRRRPAAAGLPYRLDDEPGMEVALDQPGHQLLANAPRAPP